MKAIFKLCLLLAVIVSSCNTENGSFKNLTNEDQTIVLPTNRSNPYDFIGEIFLLAIQQQIIADVSQKSAPVFDPSAVNDHKDPTDSVVYSIDDFCNIIDQSPISSATRESVVEFITTVLNLEQQGYEVVYAYIVDFESQVLNSDAYNLEEQRILLSFSSITRFASFQVDMLKTLNVENEYWDISVENLIHWFLVLLSDTYLE